MKRIALFLGTNIAILVVLTAVIEILGIDRWLVTGESNLPREMAAFGISGHLGRGLTAVFASHPPLARRIRALEAPPGA
ncbi:MAG: hypothetical protein L0H83_13315 [Salinisphaera sp.]|nr:hypothetical protein [Salinisphaera sp.]